MAEKVLQFPKQEPDAQKIMLNGKPEMALSARGVLLMCLSSWKLDKNGRAHDVLRRYCEYICSHGCPGGATKALAEVDGMSKGDDAAWIRRTFARYVKDQNSLMTYVLEALA